MATIIDGKKVSEDLREDLKVQTEKFVEETGIQPHLVVVIVGNNPASMTYVRNNKRS
ncbi:MAG: tetrahydrofolate dehydrogenase/cyclohydrolase catalytic domain-containing protein, partial [Turicibacter sanguinis]|uniref:tetrahydrofolate dehydrogenase/cyclohydrolase catalytic domain-containing protein n=1 Tax=Turicibacter sanguinis TaxID=154288 RepID=UPI0039930DDE